MRTIWVGLAALLALTACAVPDHDEDVTHTDAPLLAQGLARPDRCGSWKAVELSATVDSPKPTLLPREAREAHTFCEPIDARVPGVLDAAGTDVRGTTAILSFGATRPGSRFVHKVECLYEAHTSPDLRLVGCSGGVRAGQALVAQQFELKLWSHHRATVRRLDDRQVGVRRLSGRMLGLRRAWVDAARQGHRWRHQRDRARAD
jgi:hypothetical protein